MQMKYIVALCAEHHDFDQKHEIPVMFPQIITHSEMAASLSKAAFEADLMMEKIVGAGFCQPYFNEDGSGIRCFGKSESLSVKSREEEDSAAFARSTSRLDSTRI